MRRFLLALVISFAASIALAHVERRLADARAKTTVADLVSQPTAGAPGTTESAAIWNSRHRAGVSIPESRWKSPVVHAELAGVRSGDVFRKPQSVGRCDFPTGDGPAHLRDIPLLI